MSAGNRHALAAFMCVRMSIHCSMSTNVFKCSSATEISSEVYSWRKQWLLNNIQGCPLLILDDFEDPKMRAKNRICAKI